MLQEIAALGFDHAELSHGIRVSLVPGIMDAVDAGEIRISTLHNFCPLPMGVSHAAPNIYQFTSADPRERESALKQTFKTLDFAVRMKARLVVLHMGSLTEMKPKGGFLGLFGPADFTDTLLDMITAKEHESPKFQMLIADAVDQQERHKAGPMQRTAEALQQIAARAAELGLQLGIENREALEEVPLDGEMAQFLKEFSSRHRALLARHGARSNQGAPRLPAPRHAPRPTRGPARRVSHPRCHVPRQRPSRAGHWLH